MPNDFDTSKEPLGSTSPYVLYNNSGNEDLFVNDRTNEFFIDRPPFSRKRYTIFGMEQDFKRALANIGFESTYVAYAAGAVVQRSTQLVVRSGAYYRVTNIANLPLTLTGDWAVDSPKLTDVGDASLRSSLAAAGSTVSIGGVPASDVAKLSQALKVETDGRIRSTSNIIVGANAVTGPAVRDAYTVAREVVGLTDCHAFADKTNISGVTDYGGYGTFDATTALSGSNNQDHMFAYQDRNKYNGSGSINFFSGIISRAEHNGTGTINNRFGLDITGTTVTAGGVILEETGIRIREMVNANFNVGLRSDQRIVAGKTSYNFYAPNNAPNYFNGNLSLGADAPTTAKLSVCGGTGAKTAFMDSTASFAVVGAVGDTVFNVFTNAGSRLEIRDSTEGYTVRPGVTNVQYNGDAAKYWKGGYIGTAWQVVSDATKKTAVRAMSDAEITTAQQLANEIGIWQFLDSVEEKGEDAARLHVSMTVQKAIEVFERNGLDARRYGFICLDTWGDEYENHPAEVIEHEAVVRRLSILDVQGRPIVENVSDAWTEIVKEAWTEKVRDAGQLYSFRESGILWFIMAGLNSLIRAES